ncbi:MAG: ArnT family glycosyltransferase [Pirellulaceae bacterium]
MHSNKYNVPKLALPLLCVMVIGGIYLFCKLPYEWIPHDEGLLAQSANRVLNGELPHHDFQDAYTGGLSYLHAASMSAFGVSLYSIRLCLFITALLTIPAWYLVAARFITPIAAATTTLVCLTWSFPNYLAALPTWYTLAFASWTLFALLKYGDSLSSKWLMIAGLMCGISICIKIVGLYPLAATLLCIVYRQLHCQSLPEGTTSNSRLPTNLAVAVIGVTLVGLVIALIKYHLGINECVMLVLPVAITSAILFHGAISADMDLRVLIVRCVKPFSIALGCTAIPILVLLIPYLSENAVGDLLHGVLVLPQQRLGHAEMALPPLFYMIPCALSLFCFYKSNGSCNKNDRLLAIGLITAGSLLLLIAYFVFPGTTLANSVYVWTFHSIRMIVPALCVLLAVHVIKHERTNSKRYVLFVGCAMTGLISLIQYPYSFGIYFCYTAPIVLLTAIVLLHADPDATTDPKPNKTWWAAQILLLLFGVLWLNTSYIRGFGVRHNQTPVASYMQSDDIPRLGLTVDTSDLAEYQFLKTLVRSLTNENDTILAFPDCPEVYFLSEKKNPTAVMYDFFGTAGMTTDEIEDYYIGLLDEHQPAVVIINRIPEFSSEIPELIPRILASRYRKSASSPGRLPKFTVYFHDPGF